MKPLRSTFVLSAKQRQDAGGAELRQPVQVHVLAVERRLIDLEVAGVNNDARAACGSPPPRSRACCA